MSSDKFNSQEQQELWHIMQEINKCWLKGQIAKLKDYFDNNIVFNSPDFKHQIAGKDNCIQTYFDFIERSTVLFSMRPTKQFTFLTMQLLLLTTLK